ncbi:MAG: sulfurtransferase TusA family protein [Sutterellaceae bacterium]|nr:sulfurtransferase TusA family protein [Sutterellaceae bacterium]
MREIDLCGLKCPMPVLRVKKVLKDAGSDETIAFVTDDPHAPEDIRVFAAQSGHTIVSQDDLGDGRVRNALRRRAQ